jgi:signal transduction histidine kinase/DNA-binding response OmpR family regulator
MSRVSPTLRILLIEDNPGDAGLIRYALQHSGGLLASLDWAKTLRDGKALAGQQAYDAVLLDLTLPDSSGLATVTALRQAAPALPIVVMTGHDDMAFALGALDAGAQDYLVKGDVSEQQLVRSIRYARERQQLELELERSRERFRAFAEAGSDWLWETDAEHRLTCLSEGFESITGIPPGTALGRTRAELYFADGEEVDFPAHLATLDRHEPFKNFEFPQLDLAGQVRYFRISGTPFFLGERFLGYRGVGTEVTRFKVLGNQLRDRLNDLELSRRQMEQQAAEMAQLAEAAAAAKDRAEAAAKAKADFLATMSHEIRTPMTGVLGMVDLLLGEDMTPRQRHLVAVIREAGETLVTILNDILDISKLEAGRLDLTPAPTDLRMVVGSVCQLFEARAAERGNQLRVDMAADVPVHVVTDGHRLRQVLFNLVGNAVKFTNNGTITLSVESAGPDGDGDGDGGRIVTFTVTDTGIGIAAEHLTGLFSRFQQADATTAQRFGGTGLGLALCKAITELMGGEIGVDSTPGRGSRFRVAIPVEVVSGDAPDGERDKAAAPAAAAATGTATGAAGLRMLVAEDNRINQMLLREILGRLGEVVLAGNGQEALDAYDTRGPFGLVVLDVRMPVMGGLEALRLLRARPDGRTVPVLILSADVMPEHVDSYRAAGADAYLGKPIDVRALVTTTLRLVGA